MKIRLKLKIGLLPKFILLFWALMYIMVMSVGTYMAIEHSELVQEMNTYCATRVVEVVKETINEKRILEYARSGKEDEEYNELLEQVKEIQKQYEIYYIYVVALENEEKGIYYFDLKWEAGKSEVVHRLGLESDLKKNYPGLTEVIDSKEPSSQFDDTSSGEETLKSMYAPVLDEMGKVVAFVGVDISGDKISQEEDEYIDQIVDRLRVVMGVCCVICMIIIYFVVLRPIHRLKIHAGQIAEGKFGGEVKVRGHDELAEIAVAFNSMSQNISRHMEEMKRLNDVYYRYVPAKILSLLKKSSIEDICPGNGVNTMLTIFSLQLADFDRSIRSKNTTEMITDINRVLNACVPVVVEQKGMVENFQNAGFNVVFDNGCRAALLSAVTICQKLNWMVKEKQLDRNQVGIGIAYGEVMLGIVGQESRMAAITVSQYRDTACWLQGVAERYQAHILITQTAAERIPDFFETYHSRTLGFLYNTYTGYTDRVYDVYDGDFTEDIESKNETKELFERGVELYCTRDFSGARKQFIEVLKRFRRDRAAKEYLYLCDKYISSEYADKADIYFTKME
ncbi:MAG: HAMP domain-containing protein [Lachnospiraceae bacterium]|nr:HAMP domain-containing protein [Lachnospiraceae bacterium]